MESASAQRWQNVIESGDGATTASSAIVQDNHRTGLYVRQDERAGESTRGNLGIIGIDGAEGALIAMALHRFDHTRVVASSAGSRPAHRAILRQGSSRGDERGVK